MATRLTRYRVGPASRRAGLVEARRLRQENAQLRSETARLKSDLDGATAERDRWLLGWPPGHFYSPLPSIEDVKRKEAAIFRIPGDIPAVNINSAGQVQLFEELKTYYAEQPFQDGKQDDIRYYFDNPNFSYGEAIILYCMIRHIKPRRIIEIGSGYSSCVTIDTSERFLEHSVRYTFIEPYPDLLLSLLKEEDTGRVEIIRSDLQEVDVSTFSELAAGDMLFIDSTHVSKINSDVNYILFDILPRLKQGVYIHFHDIGYPFEYPKEWIYQGRAWNEAYILRAFLQYNNTFEIQFFNSFFGYFHHSALAEHMPLCAKNPGTSIWLKKTS
jgi:hypothetical protein